MDFALQGDGFADSVGSNRLFAVQPKQGGKLRMSVLRRDTPARSFECGYRRLWVKSLGQAKLLERLQTHIDILRGSSGAARDQNQECEGG